MTQVHFTLGPDEIQNLINEYVSDRLAKNLLPQYFTNLWSSNVSHTSVQVIMKDEEHVRQRNGYYERAYRTRVGSLTLHVPRARDGKFSTDLFER